MGFFRDLWVDLVDKKLWPVAIALVVAPIAVPVLLTKSSAAPIAPLPAGKTGSVPGGLPAPGAAADLTQVSGSASAGTVEGAARDPFRQQHVPKVAAVSTTAATASPSAGATATAAQAGSPGPAGTPATTHHATPAPRTTKVVVRFGPTSGSRPEVTLDALEPLPNRTKPVIVYLGQLKDGSTASFLVSADSRAPTGDGRCLPNHAICSTIYLRPGDTEYFDLARGKSTVQYQLDFKRFFSS